MKREYFNIEHMVLHEIFTEQLQEAKARHISPASSSGEAAGVNECVYQSYLAAEAMSALAENPAEREIVSWRKSRILSGIVIFFKRAIRKLLRWYIVPFTDQQSRFNNASTVAASRTAQAAQGLMEQLSESREREKHKLDGLYAQVGDLSGRLDLMSSSVHNLDTTLKELKVAMEDRAAAMEDCQGKLNIGAAKRDVRIEKLERLSELNEEYLRYSKDQYYLTNPSRKPFSLFNKASFSQSGEDSICAYVLYELGLLDFEKITYLDLGANDPIVMSNTYLFYLQGARGVLVEANPFLAQRLEAARPEDSVVKKLVDTVDDEKRGFYILNGDGLSSPDYNQVEEVMRINPSLRIEEKIDTKTVTVNTLIKSFFDGKAPTILSVDIEGMDMDILASIDFHRFRPVLIVIEMVSYDINLAFQTKNSNIKFFLEEQRYVEYAYTGINAVFVDRQVLEQHREGLQ